jgi:hypothetical protein
MWAGASQRACESSRRRHILRPAGRPQAV